MQSLNDEYNGQLQLAIEMFTNQYHRPFFGQLIASQLDIDRLDYLQRDCFFTGVSEGTIGADRIIKMLDLVDDSLVVEEKGIYSIENFLNARRLMYWQVYLHKTSISAEQILILILKRARHLIENGYPLFSGQAFSRFLKEPISLHQLKSNPSLLKDFASLDDIDIWGAIKVWQYESDKVIMLLCKSLLDRKLFKIKLYNSSSEIPNTTELLHQIQKKYDFTPEEASFLLSSGTITNAAYIAKGKLINILTKKGKIKDVAQASDLPNIKAISKIVKKYYVCHPKNITL